MKKAKKINPSMDKEKQTDNPNALERLKNVDFNNEYSWRMRPVTDAYLEKMARELEDWAVDEKNNLRPYSLTNFTRPRRLRRSILNEWAAKNEVFKASLEFVKEALGSRRYDLRVEHRFDEKAFFLNQGKYDDEFDADFEKYNKTIKLSQANGSQLPTKLFISSVAAQQVGLEPDED